MNQAGYFPKPNPFKPVGTVNNKWGWKGTKLNQPKVENNIEKGPIDEGFDWSTYDTLPFTKQVKCFSKEFLSKVELKEKMKAPSHSTHCSCDLVQHNQSKYFIHWRCHGVTSSRVCYRDIKNHCGPHYGVKCWGCPSCRIYVCEDCMRVEQLRELFIDRED